MSHQSGACDNRALEFKGIPASPLEALEKSGPVLRGSFIHIRRASAKVRHTLWSFVQALSVLNRPVPSSRVRHVELNWCTRRLPFTHRLRAPITWRELWCCRPPLAKKGRIRAQHSLRLARIHGVRTWRRTAMALSPIYCERRSRRGDDRD
jgi:hypothetical protein